MSNEEKALEIGYARDLLLALEVGTRKEDRKLTDGLLSRHGITRPLGLTARSVVDRLSQSIVAGPGFENLFVDLVRCVRPFALMVQDVIGFLASNAATTERRSTSVRVSLRGAARGFDFDLSAFPREKLEAIIRARGRVSVLRFTEQAKGSGLFNTSGPSSCWRAVNPIWDGDFYDDGFFRALSYAGTISQRKEGGRQIVADLVTATLDRLAALIQILKWPEVFLGSVADSGEDASYMEGPPKAFAWSVPAHSGSILDRVGTLRAFGNEVLPDDAGRLGYVLQGIARAVYLWSQEGFIRRDHGDWLSKRLGEPFEAIEFSRYLQLMEEETAKIAAALDNLVEAERSEVVETDMRAVVEFLRLPFWRDRWFLYELWTVVHVLGIGAAAWQLRLVGLVLRDDGGLEWVLPGGTAKEPIAVLAGQARSVECWTQRKTYHPETKEGLEPDLRLTRANDRHDDLVIIENKDRIKPRRREMEEIIERYVTGTQARAVWLVNYEEFSDSTHLAGDKYSEREVAVESHFRPGEVSERFSGSLLAVLSKELGPSNREKQPALKFSTAEAATTVVLSWEGLPKDLDLHAWVREGTTTEHIYFNNRGRPGSQPHVQLNGDCQQSPGQEILVVERIVGETVEVAVHQFSNDGELAASKARVEIRRPGLGITTLSIPGSGRGRWWMLGCFNRDGSLAIRNRITTEP